MGSLAQIATSSVAKSLTLLIQIKKIMSDISEDELIAAFTEDIETYPFKTHIQYERNCKAGRIDIALPDYNVAIEAKSDGSLKKAIGQALSYSVTTDMYGYILIPHTQIENWVLEACERAGVGVLTTRETSLNFAVAYDVGGLESFHPKHYENVQCADFSEIDCRKETVVGGIDN